MTHSRDGTEIGFPRIRGKSRDDPGGRWQLVQSVNSMLIFNLLTCRKRPEWENYGQ